MATVKVLIMREMVASGEIVFTSADLIHLGERKAVSRALQSLCLEQKIIRISTGMYVLAEISLFGGKAYVPHAPMEIALEAMRKLGVKAQLGRAYRDYNDGISTQVPATSVIDVGKSRVARKIRLGKRFLIYERS